MFRISPSYQRPFYIALALHGILLLLFCFSPSQAPKVASAKTLGSVQPKVVTVSAVSEQQVAAQMHQLQQAATERESKQRRVLAALTRQARAAEHRAKLAQAQQHQQARLTARLHQQQVALKKQLQASKSALMKHRAQAKQIRDAAQHALNEKASALDQRLLNQALSDASQHARAAAAKHAAAGAAVIQQYTSQIVAAIQQHWAFPAGANPAWSCLYEIVLSPSGAVTQVRLIRSSGHPALDYSARVAIVKASPLPVPKTAALFDNFRVLRLTLSPKSRVLK